jgi:hypothetical protein
MHGKTCESTLNLKCIKTKIWYFIIYLMEKVLEVLYMREALMYLDKIGIYLKA